MQEKLKWYTGLGVAVLNDINDVIGFGSVPILGDILDVATSAYLWPLMGKREKALSFVEFIPYADYLPTYTSLLLWSWKRNGPEMPEVFSRQKGMKEINID